MLYLVKISLKRHQRHHGAARCTSGCHETSRSKRAPYNTVTKVTTEHYGATQNLTVKTGHRGPRSPWDTTKHQGAPRSTRDCHKTSRSKRSPCNTITMHHGNYGQHKAPRAPRASRAPRAPRGTEGHLGHNRAPRITDTTHDGQQVARR